MRSGYFMFERTRSGKDKNKYNKLGYVYLFIFIFAEEHVQKIQCWIVFETMRDKMEPTCRVPTLKQYMSFIQGKN